MFSEINNMFFAMVWALDNKVRFELCSQRSNLGDEGWNDFFEPFTGEKCSEFLVRNNRRFVSDIKGYDKKKVRAGKKKEKIDFLTQDIFKRFFENRAFAEKVFDFPELGIAGGSFAAAAGLARAFYRLNAATETAGIWQQRGCGWFFSTAAALLRRKMVPEREAVWPGAENCRKSILRCRCGREISARRQHGGGRGCSARRRMHEKSGKCVAGRV